MNTLRQGKSDIDEIATSTVRVDRVDGDGESRKQGTRKRKRTTGKVGDHWVGGMEI